MEKIKNPITKLIQKKFEDHYKYSSPTSEKLSVEEIKDRTETKITNILKMCSELGPFYAILKGLVCTGEHYGNKDSDHWIDSIKELFRLFEDKMSFVVYESVSLVYEEPSGEVENK